MNKKEMLSYDTDASRLVGKALKVVFPKTGKEIENIIKTSKLDIVPRGGGTGLMGGSVPNNSLVVDVSKMNKIISFDKAKEVVYVEAGICIKELNEKLNSIGFGFPIQPLNQAATIGGLAAVNISDSRSLRYGKIKQWIEEIEFVNGKGELIKTSKADLADVCGMEGITGIITKLKLKVLPKIKRSISIFQTDNLDKILSTARRLKLEKEVVMLELFSKQVSEMIDLPEKYNLIIEFDSDRGKITGSEYERIIKLKEKVYYALIEKQYYNIEDPKFFFDKLKEFILYLESNQIPYFGNLGSGIIHPFFKDNEGKRKETIKLIKKMNGKLGEYGVGTKRKDFLDDFEKKIIQRVKSRHDPFGKLNKGKVIDFEEKVTDDSDVGHLKPLQEEEIEKIRPIIVGASKSEEKEVEEELEEREEIEKGKEEKPDESQELVRDYEYVFKSELADEKKKKIEEFARDVPREIGRREEKKEEKEENKY